LVLADYGQDVSEIVRAARDRYWRVRVRRHPAEKPGQRSLEADIMLAHTVIGTSGTALFDALVRGVPGVCLDPRNVCAPVCVDSIDAELYRGDREAWLHDMSYCQFTLEEIADGTAWELLKCAQPD